MKKFISLMAVVVIFISVSSCRETEEILVETNKTESQLIVSKAINDSVASQQETNQSNTPTNNTSNLEEKDTEKDKIKW